MKVLATLAACVCCVAASAGTPTEDIAEPHHQVFACPVGGCNVSCPTTGHVPAIQFRASALKLTVLPSRVAVFDATSGFDKRKTYLVDLSERNCEIEQ